MIREMFAGKDRFLAQQAEDKKIIEEHKSKYAECQRHQDFLSRFIISLYRRLEEKDHKLKGETQRANILEAQLRSCKIALGEEAVRTAPAVPLAAPPTGRLSKPQGDANFHLKVHFLKKPVIMDDKRGVVFEKWESAQMAKNRRKREARAAKRTRALLEEAASASPKEDTTKEDVCEDASPVSTTFHSSEDVCEEASPVSTTPPSSRCSICSGGGPPSKRARTSLAREGDAMQHGDDRDSVSTTLHSSSGSDDGARSDAQAVDRASDPSGAVLAERGLEPCIADGGPGGKKPSGWRARNRVSSPSSK